MGIDKADLRAMFESIEEEWPLPIHHEHMHAHLEDGLVYICFESGAVHSVMSEETYQDALKYRIKDRK